MPRGPPLWRKEGSRTTRCLSAFSSRLSQTVPRAARRDRDSLELPVQRHWQPRAPAHTLSSLSTLEQIVRNLLSGTPQTANIPSRMRRSLTWGEGASYELGETLQLQPGSLLSALKRGETSRGPPRISAVCVSVSLPCPGSSAASLPTAGTAGSRQGWGEPSHSPPKATDTLTQQRRKTSGGYKSSRGHIKPAQEQTTASGDSFSASPCSA